jgi:hypothetical protein
MKTPAENQFDSLKSACRYLAVLSAELEEAQHDVDDYVELAKHADANRRVDALQLTAYKLDQLRHHLRGSRRALNDLRMLRRLLQAKEPVASGSVSYNQEDALARDPK